MVLMSSLRRVVSHQFADWMALPLKRLDPLGAEFPPLEAAESGQARRLSDGRRRGDGLTVMSWNIKFGGGRLDFFFDGHDDRVHMSEQEVLENLAGVCEKIEQVDPDVVLLQEVDRCSRRVAGVDQFQWVLDHTPLNFGVYASQWRARYLPAYGLGPVDMGNCILSRFPLHDGLRQSLPQSQVQAPVVRYFYLKRHLLTASVEIPGARPLQVVNLHAEAFSSDDIKRVQLQRFVAELDRIDAAGGVFVAGGDLNTLPPGTRRLHGFEDAVQEDEHFQASDYRHEAGWLDELYARYQPAVDLTEFARDNAPHFTHSTSVSTFWNRKLDYLFTNKRFKEGSVLTHQDQERGGMETMQLSDHAPLTAVIPLQELSF